MLLTNLNLEKGLCNGSRGVIVGYQSSVLWQMPDMTRHGYSTGQRMQEFLFANQRLPVVQFADGNRVTIGPKAMQRQQMNGQIEVERIQVGAFTRNSPKPYGP